MMRRYERGDTIVEIVLAFAIFSLAAVTTMAILSKGVATTQGNLEVTLVRQQIDAQAEMLRYIHDTQNSAWATLVAPSAITTSPLPLSSSCDTRLPGAFYVQPTINADPTLTTFTRKSITTSTYVHPSTYALINYSAGATQSQGIWIQVAKAQSAGSVIAYDFYIHACWDSVSSSMPMTTGTIVRIYD